MLPDAVLYGVFFIRNPMITSSSPSSDACYAKHIHDGLTLPAHDAQFRLLGDSIAMQQVRERILRLAKSNAPVAIYGESG